MAAKLNGQVAADRTPSMRENGWNSGRKVSKAPAGSAIFEDYGLDRSSLAGSERNERGDRLAGSTTDLSHSIKGIGPAHQEGEIRGRKDNIVND